MGAELLLQRLQARGSLVSLSPKGTIRVEAPEGALDDKLRDQIRQQRDELIAILRSHPREEERECRFSSFASASTTAGMDLSFARTMRTQKPQVYTSDLVIHGESWTGSLAPVPAGLPDEWRSGREQLPFMLPPHGFTPARWRTGVIWARKIGSEHGPAAFAMGWAAEDLFGLCTIAPSARYDEMGLAFLLQKACRIASLNSDRAVIRHASGSVSTYYLGHRPAASRPAWELPQTPDFQVTRLPD